jgi:hypothetical protein
LNSTLDLLPAFIFTLILAGYIVFWYVGRGFRRSQKYSAAIAENGLRAPGQILNASLNETSREIKFNLALMLSIPIVLLCIHVTYIAWFNATSSSLSGIVIWGAGGAVIFFYLATFLKLIRKRKFLRLGFESELTVGEALNNLSLDGIHVYHDFPADDFKIDHIVVGAAGIFTVDAIARSAPTNTGSGKDASTVEYNGKMLNFPREDNYQIIEQAEGQAKWLSEWISGAIEEPVAARAIVALPGWFVKRTSADGISVVNPEQFPSLFKHIKPRPLSEETIARIVDRLQQKYRVTDTFTLAEDQGQMTV